MNSSFAKNLILLVALVSAPIVTLLPTHSLAQIPAIPSVLEKKEKFDILLDTLEAKYANAEQGPIKIIRYWDMRFWAPAAGIGPSGQREVYVQGGALLLPIITSGSLAFTVCHEIGHHLGGAPLKSDHSMVSSVESQADFFTTSSCLPKILSLIDTQTLRVSDTDRDFAKEFCTQESPPGLRFKRCEKLVLISLNTARTFSKDVNPTTPSALEVTTTVEKYPSDQCRLDTFLAGIKKYLDAGTEGGETNGDIEYRPKCWLAQ